MRRQWQRRPLLLGRQQLSAFFETGFQGSKRLLQRIEEPSELIGLEHQESGCMLHRTKKSADIICHVLFLDSGVGMESYQRTLLLDLQLCRTDGRPDRSRHVSVSSQAADPAASKIRFAGSPRKLAGFQRSWFQALCSPCDGVLLWCLCLLLVGDLRLGCCFGQGRVA